MAIDTAEERRCVGGNMPTPDSTISIFDRRQIAGNYRGMPVLLSKGGTLNINKSTLATNLVGWWPLSQANYQGGVFVDESVNNNDGTPANVPSFAINAFRNPVGATVLNGSTDEVVIGDVLDIGTGDYTVSVWARADDYTGVIISKWDGGGYYLRLSNIGYDGKGIYTRFSDGVDTYEKYKNTLAEFNYGNWNHIVMVFDEDVGVKLYINGVELAGLSSAGVFGDLGDIDSAADIIFGQVVGVQYFDGSLADIRIYNRVLSDAEIKLLYTPSLAMTLELYRDVSGGMTPAGVLARALTAYRGLGGGLTPTGAVIPAPFFEMVLGGELDLYGAIAASNPDWLLIDDLLTWMGEWDETWSYDIDDVVLYKIDGGNEWHVFVSKISHNVGNIPTRVASAWRRLYQEQWL